MNTTLTTAQTDKALNVRAMTTDGLEQLLVECERSISRLRNIQSRIVCEVDRREVARADGARHLGEWIAGRVDIDTPTPPPPSAG